MTAGRRAAPAPESTMPSAAAPSAAAPAPAAKQAKPRRGTIFAGYLNFIVCMVLLAYARQLLVTGGSAFDDPYRPFLIARYAIFGLAAGMLFIGLRLWLIKNRVARRHGRVIFFISLLGVAIGTLLFA